MRLMLYRLCCLGFTLVASSSPGSAGPDTPFDPSLEIPIQLAWDQKIAMRDGVKLSATIYRDPKQTKRLPAIVTMTPYIAAHAAKQGVYFAQHGYVFVAIDARGRGNSDGVFVPGRVEAKDGYDAIEWVASQAWCDGKVATWGGSWLGFTQWSIAKGFPPHLAAMAPTAAVYPGIDYPQPHGIFMSYMLRWLTYVHGRARNDSIFEHDALWTNAEWQQLASGLPFADLDKTTGVINTVFRTWLAHPREDAYWQAITPRPADYAKLRVPILTITGHYDDDQLGALTYYDRHMAYGSADAKARHWLVIGPWDHGGTRRPKDELGGVTFGAGASINMEELHKAWYDHVLKGGPVPGFLKDRVALFVMGRNAWMYASDLRRLEGALLTFKLDATGAVAGDVTRSAHLAVTAPRAPATVALTADPRYLPPRNELDAENPAFLRNQRDAYTDLRSQVAWHTAPFAADTVLTGRPRLRLQVASDQPDADLFASLYEVLADGTAIQLATTMVRLRYRKGGIDPVPMVPGNAERVELPPFSLFARSIAKGSRLRLVLNAGPVWGWQHNSHTGGDLVSEPSNKGRVATITIATGGDSGSVLELPQPDPAILDRKDPPAKPR
jgi:putative CocE/NonD family hydrolase